MKTTRDELLNILSYFSPKGGARLEVTQYNELFSVMLRQYRSAEFKSSRYLWNFTDYDKGVLVNLEILFANPYELNELELRVLRQLNRSIDMMIELELINVTRISNGSKSVDISESLNLNIRDKMETFFDEVIINGFNKLDEYLYTNRKELSEKAFELLK